MLYSKDALEACRQVLNDVICCLRDYEDRFYLIGGWAVISWIGLVVCLKLLDVAGTPIFAS